MSDPWCPRPDAGEERLNGWFGESWGAPVCDPETHVETPVGSSCLRCEEPIDERDRGMVMPYLVGANVHRAALHLECQMRSVIGGALCIEGTCTGCGDGSSGWHADSPHLSDREAAIAAMAAWERRYG